MRFLERAIKALGYHRRPYLAGAIVSICFTVIAIMIQTASALNQATRLNFKTRLAQFDTSALKSAAHLIDQVQQAYAAVQQDFNDAFWWTLAGFTLIAILFAITLAYLRRRETDAYILVGKSTADIVAQYVFESLVIFIIGFIIAAGITECFTQRLTAHLTATNLTRFEAHLDGHVSAKTYHQLTQQLFNHRLTDFSGAGLVFPHRGLQANTTKLCGLTKTFFSGALSLIVSQTLVFVISVWRQRAGIRHRA